MIKIDGDKIRRLRESKGLTQLYLATYVGVTTDTISRWENKRYQTIKQGNAVKLAEALEVGLKEILDTEEVERDLSPRQSDAEPPSQKEPPLQQGNKKRQLLVVVLFVLLLAAGLFFFQNKQPDTPAILSMTAERIFPVHCAPDQLLPVIIRIKASGTEPISLIIREELPAGLQAVQGSPPFTAVDKEEGSLKWLSKITAKEATYAYLCRTPATIPSNHRLFFSGTVTGKQMAPIVIQPENAFLEIAPFHWADTDRDLKISDEEILSVYDHYSEFEKMGIDFALIEEIWSANGYRWNETKRQFNIIE